MFHRYLTFLKIASDEYSDIVVDAELHADRVRLILIDGSWIEVRYPVEDKFSFHWQRSNKIYRIDTAPHHKDIRTFSRHIHFGSEDNVIEDYVLEENVSPEENFKRFMEWMSELLKRN
ncbi:hypothetical protein ES705_09117 [subsurface metagenome]|nr:hypothetical protein [Methanosarcinales archaeon]